MLQKHSRRADMSLRLLTDPYVTVLGWSCLRADLEAGEKKRS